MTSRPPRDEDTAAPAAAGSEDVLLPHARTEDGEGVHVLRKRGDSIQTGTLRAARDGQPLHGELVALEPRPGTPLYDVKVLHDARPAAATGRPAKVATRAFRDGWDRIWGGPAEEKPS